MKRVKKGSNAGRPTKYNAEYAEQAYKLCLLGATDKQLADFLGVAESTLNLWKLEHPDFSESLKNGKDRADAVIAQSLFHRAKGYTHDAVKIVADAKTGAEHIVPFTEHYPPDTTACIFWLKNRQKENWRDRVEHVGDAERPIEHKVNIIGDILKLLPADALEKLADEPGRS
jgi:hypothetical protein